MVLDYGRVPRCNEYLMFNDDYDYDLCPILPSPQQGFQNFGGVNITGF